ncbi:hypothetical protein F66182_14350, partial [Fusarium sp. NRRL 66182]
IEQKFHLNDMTPLSLQEVRNMPVDHDLDPNGNMILVFINPEVDSTNHSSTDNANIDAYSGISMAVHCGQPSEPEEPEGEAGLPSNTQTADSEKLEAVSSSYRVKWQQLCLVSRYFKNLFTGPWFENAHFQRDGGIKLYLWEEKWDPVALLILFRIMHYQLCDIPEIIDLSLLGKIVVIAEYLQCIDFLSEFLRLWGLDALSQYRRHIAFGIDNDTVVRDGLLCTFISWKLRLHGEFRLTTKFLVLWAQGPTHDPGASIDECIIG